MEFVKVIFRYYIHFSYFKKDVYLLLLYLFRNPYRIQPQSYGETYLTTMHTIAKHCHILSSDCIYELGAGRGRTLFWLEHFIKCKVVGVEFIEAFANKCEKVRKRFGINAISVLQEDMLKVDLSSATVIYFYGTSFSDDFVKALLKNLENLKRGTKVITVSFPLSEYDTQAFKLIKSFKARYPWGEADLFLQIKN